MKTIKADSTWTLEKLKSIVVNEDTAIEGLPESVYHAFPAMSASGLKDFYKSPAFWKWKRENPSSNETPARRWGRLVHVALNEQDRFNTAVEVIPGKWNTDAIRDKIRIASAAGKFVVKPEEFEAASRVYHYCKNEHPLLKLALKDGSGERSLFFKHPKYGFWCKARIDWVYSECIFDWKTYDKNDSEDSIELQIRNMYYDFQDAWYSWAYTVVYKKKPKNFYNAFIRCEYEDDAKNAFVSAQVTELAEISREEVLPAIDMICENYASCLREDSYPKKDDQVITVVVKPWRG